MEQAWIISQVISHVVDQKLLPMKTIRIKCYLVRHLHLVLIYIYAYNIYMYTCVCVYVCVQILSAIVHKSPNDLYNYHILSLYNSTIFSWCIGGFSSKNSLFDQMCDHLYIVWKSHMISTSNCLKNRYILHSMINLLNLLIIMQTLWKQPHLGYICTALSRQTDKPKKTGH